MTLSLRHITLLIGVLTTIVSLFWFGRATTTYNILILVGLMISTISFLLIIFKKDTLKSKLLWTCLVIISIGLQWLTEPTLTRLSYKHFIEIHEADLNFVTELIKSKKSNLFTTPSSELWTRHGYTKAEADQIKKRFSETGISFIEKDSSKIYYRTSGTLDISHGIYYFYSDSRPDEHYKNIFGNWYY